MGAVSREPGAHVGVEVRTRVEHPGKDRQVGAAVGEMAGNEGQPRVLLDRALQRGDDFVVPEHARLVGDLPLERVHQAVVGAVHRLVHPAVLTDVDIHGQAELGALLQDRVHAGIIDVHR